MPKCLCTDPADPNRISASEKVMAAAEGLDPNDVHAFMCAWERYAERTISAQPGEGWTPATLAAAWPDLTTPLDNGA